MTYLIHMLLFLHLAIMSHFDICMCLGGASLEVSSQIISDNSICFVIIKKGEIIDLKAISPSFDDNKIYVVLFLTISFSKISGSFCCISAPSQDSH